ncbi:hypothetical protein Dimus_024475 [Dionaea muscipula]
MEILTAEVFDGDFDGSGLRLQYTGDGLTWQSWEMEMSPAESWEMEMSTAEIFDGDFDGREGLQWQSWEMEMSTAEKGFDVKQLLFDGFCEFVGAAVEGRCVLIAVVLDVIFQSYEG